MSLLVVIDIETAPGEGFESHEDAALDHHRNRITQIAWTDTTGVGGVVQSIDKLNELIAIWRPYNPTFGGHNFKFDLKTLITKGAHLSSADYTHDSMLQAVALYDKIPTKWLADYEEQRIAINKAARKEIHRKAGQYSLKSLAPYRLGVDPFWEAADHNDAAYALKDAQHTLDLITEHNKLLISHQCAPFYNDKLMRWARLFLDAELHGLPIDLDLMAIKQQQSEQLAVEADISLRQQWKGAEIAYLNQQESQLATMYIQMCTQAIERSPKAQQNPGPTKARYDTLYAKARTKLEPLNLDSPTQLKWVLKDYFGFDVTTVEGDESTGKSVLNKLAEDGNADVATLLTYRKHSKLLKAFYPSYKAMQVEGSLYPSFNLNGARTGRISCSSPNIQQVPSDLHNLFVAKPGYKLVCYDLSNIEPMLIAYLTECPILCDLMINNKSFHDANVITMFNADCSIDDVKKLYPNERKLAKTVGLALLYGAGPTRIEQTALQAGMPFTQSHSRDVYNRFKKRYSHIYEYKKHLDRRLEEGEPITNLLGRQFVIADKSDVYMKGFNTLIQGSGSDILIESACRVQEQASHLDSQFLAAIHDEMIFHVKESDAPALDANIHEVINSYKLPTQYGDIQLKVEGGIFDYWKH